MSAPAFRPSPTTRSVQPATRRDKVGFVASPKRSIRVRSSIIEERVAANVREPAKTILVALCKGDTFKIVVPDKPLACDVSEAVTLLAQRWGRPFREVDEALHALPLIPAADLGELAERFMNAVGKCRGCTCGAVYAPVVAALAVSSRQPWTQAGVFHRVEEISRTQPPLIIDDNRKAEGDAVRQVIRAAGFEPCR